MRLLNQLWNEDAGFVMTSEATIMLTLLVCAAIVGWQAVRVSLISELTDLADSIAAIDQSYSYAGFTSPNLTLAGSVFVDNRDFCDDTDCVQADGGFGRCVVLTGAVKEDGVVASGSGGA